MQLGAIVLLLIANLLQKALYRYAEWSEGQHFPSHSKQTVLLLRLRFISQKDNNTRGGGTQQRPRQQQPWSTPLEMKVKFRISFPLVWLMSGFYHGPHKRHGAPPLHVVGLILPSAQLTWPIFRNDRNDKTTRSRGPLIACPSMYCWINLPFMWTIKGEDGLNSHSVGRCKLDASGFWG